MSSRQPALALGVGAGLVALVAAWIGLRLRVVVLDEAVYKFAAAQYVDRFPHELIDDKISRGAARLYALVLAPLSAVFEGDVAVRAGRVLNALLWGGTVVPVYLLARRVVKSASWAAIAAVLAVAVPWFTLATILFSEALAYFLFALVLLAMVRALERPGLRADVLVLVLLLALVLTRVQFVVLLPAWVLLLAWQEWPHRGDLRAVARRRPVIALGVVLGIVAALVIVLAGQLDRVLTSLGGPYERLRDRDSLQGDFGLALLFEVEMFAIGVGVIPAILAAAWAVRAWRGGAGEAARRLALVGLVAVVAVFAGTLFAQGGWLGERSEERYFIYVVPLLWIFAVAACERLLVTRRMLVIGGAALAVVCALVPVVTPTTGEQIFLGPVSRIVTHVAPQVVSVFETVTGLDGVISTRDATALVVLLIALAGAWLARRRSAFAVLVPAVVVQLVLCGYAVWAIDRGLGDQAGLTGGPPFASLGWVDRSLEGSEGVTLVQQDAGGERGLVFWNDQVLDAIRPPGVAPGDLLYPVNALRARTAEVGADGSLTVGPERALVVGLAESAYLQLDGEDVATSPDGDYVLRRSNGSALWVADALAEQGRVTDEAKVIAAPGKRYAVKVVPPAPYASTAVEVVVGDQARTQDGTVEATLMFDTCRETGAVAGRITPLRAVDVPGSSVQSASRVESVRVSDC